MIWSTCSGGYLVPIYLLCCGICHNFLPIFCFFFLLDCKSPLFRKLFFLTNMILQLFSFSLWLLILRFRISFSGGICGCSIIPGRNKKSFYVVMLKTLNSLLAFQVLNFHLILLWDF